MEATTKLKCGLCEQTFHTEAEQREQRVHEELLRCTS